MSVRKPTSDDFTFDQNLREIPKDPAFITEAVKDLRTELLQETDPQKRCRMFGELGVYLRTLGKLIEAEAAVAASLKLIQSEKLGVRLETQQRIRFAHILQMQRRFAESSALFDEVLIACEDFREAFDLLDFAWQHTGKNYFDQGKYKEALKAFNKALELRLEKESPQDQIDSTKLAIQETEKRIKAQG